MKLLNIAISFGLLSLGCNTATAQSNGRLNQTHPKEFDFHEIRTCLEYRTERQCFNRRICRVVCSGAGGAAGGAFGGSAGAGLGIGLGAGICNELCDLVPECSNTQVCVRWSF